MAEIGTPHFHNTPGVPAISIGAREFMCIGAAPPLDHPHIFLDMGNEDEIVCPYCSTLYRFRNDLARDEADPAACIWRADPVVAR